LLDGLARIGGFHWPAIGEDIVEGGSACENKPPLRDGKCLGGVGDFFRDEFFFGIDAGFRWVAVGVEVGDVYAEFMREAPAETEAH